VLDEVNNLVGVTPLVVVPSANLYESIGKSDTGLSVEDGGAGIGVEVGRNYSVLGVTKDTLKGALGSSLHGLADLSIGSGLSEVAGEVNDGYVRGGNTQRHTGELAVELGDDLADSLCSAGGGGDDVVSSSTATTPILNRNTVNGLLGSGDGVNGGHETLGDAPVVVENLGDGSQAVGGAGSVGNEVHVAGVLVVVNTHNEHGGVVLSRSRHNNLLSTGSDVALSLLLGEEEAGGLYDVLSTELTPGEVLLLALGEASDLAAVYDEGLLSEGNLAVELAVYGVVLEHVSHIVGGDEVVDANDFNVGMVEACTEDKATDAAKTVDADFDHGNHPPKINQWYFTNNNYSQNPPRYQGSIELNRKCPHR